MSKCCWKNDTNRLAQHRVVTNLQCAKNAISAKHNKVKRAACIYYAIFFHLRKKEILSFITTQMKMEGVMLSDINQRKTNSAWYHLCVES